jgi:hypothetical protein
MKSSQALTIKTVLSQKEEEIIIHPNDGFDLGLMNTKAVVKIFCNTTIEIFNIGEKDFTPGTIILANDCPQQVAQLNHKLWKKIGSPNALRLFHDNNKILISNM